MAMKPPQEQEKEEEEERSKPLLLHNFSLPCLKWGNQRLLRCVKLTHDYNNKNPSSSNNSSNIGFQSNPIIHNVHPPHNHHQLIPIPPNHVSPPPHLRFNNKRLKVSPPPPPPPPPPPSSPSLRLDQQQDRAPAANDDSSTARPWNLRTRRAACRAPPLPPPLPQRMDDKRNNNALDSTRIDSPKIRNNNYNNDSCSSPSIKFSVPLSKGEIEQDFMEMARIRPPRRPKKRPRLVQKYLDSIFPGLWLSEVTPDSYKVPEVPES